MSLVRLVIPDFSWAELAEIISYLTLRELWVLGCCNRSAFITFLRERSLRKCKHYGSLSTRFLSKHSNHEKVALISYPRSGNSFLRKLIEQEFNVVTGSDSRPNRTLAAHLLEYGYQGEAITDNSVWVVKSHYPERLGYIKFPVQRMVLVVRNPFDAIESYFHMGMTNTHDKAVTREVFLSLKDIWTPFVANEAKTWTAFHEYWLKIQSQIPVLFVRYEDLVENPQAVMGKVKAFLLGGRPPLGLKRFLRNMEATAATGAGYEPKKIRKFGKALDVMSEEDKQAVRTHCGALMDLFGYQVVQEADPTSLDGHGQCITGVQVLPEEHFRRVLDATRLLFTRLQPSSSPASTASTTGGSDGGGVPRAGGAEAGSVYINDYFTIRPKDDQYGRGITDIRKGLTKNDTQPFPTL